MRVEAFYFFQGHMIFGWAIVFRSARFFCSAISSRGICAFFAPAIVFFKGHLRLVCSGRFFFKRHMRFLCSGRFFSRGICAFFAPAVIFLRASCAFFAPAVTFSKCPKCFCLPEVNERFFGTERTLSQRFSFSL